jgi:aryl-alcohol dehydrogenase-like predicted oxidoreductase
MKYRPLGKSGAQVSELSFGAWVTFGRQADVDLAAELLKTAYDAGVNFFLIMQKSMSAARWKS